MKDRGEKFNIKNLNLDEFESALKNKLVEEAAELKSSNEIEEIINEMIDIIEVLKNLAKIYDLEWDDLEKMGERKKSERGGFEKRIFLEKIS